MPESWVMLKNSLYLTTKHLFQQSTAFQLVERMHQEDYLVFVTFGITDHACLVFLVRSKLWPKEVHFALGVAPAPSLQ